MLLKIGLVILIPKLAAGMRTVDKNQLIPSENFKVINWLEKSDSQLPDTEFTCQGFTINADECRKRAILSESLLDKYEDFLSI